MPFTRDPLEYEICRLLLKVGMALQIALFSQPPIRDRSERRRWERRQAELLELEEAIAAGLLVRYFFVWDRWSGELETIRLVPHPRHRRAPGIMRLKSLLFRRP